MNKPRQDVSLRVLQAERDGLVRVCFSNGDMFHGFYERCEDCHHYTDDLENPKPGRLEPPFAACKWGVLDRILYHMPRNTYGYGVTFHPPEDMERRDGFPVCKRYHPRMDSDDDVTNMPPPPDCKGQMTFSDVLEVMEREIRPQEARA